MDSPYLQPPPIDLAARLLGALFLFAMAAYLLYRGPREPWRFVRRLRLRRRGRLAHGQVVGVDPLGQERHDPVGHPVRVRIAADTDGAPGPTVRDPDGLRGYLIREGARVTVRYLPEKPSRASVYQVDGPSGSYRPYGGVLVARRSFFASRGHSLSSCWGSC